MTDVVAPFDDEVFRVVVDGLCPHTDCLHEDTYHCSGWSYAEDALSALYVAGYGIVRLDSI